ncbi:MAG: hypothetical protein CMO80_13005 [Verrucomicrobiales bacterium]|nr:hypothetical protein [Verrucomicrobiales bacterium]
MKKTLLFITLIAFVFSVLDATAQRRPRVSKNVGGKSLAEDIAVISEAQGQALELAQALLSKKETKEDKESAQKIIDMIKQAQKFTEQARNDREKLNDAVRAQEVAFQALLELATREHQVRRQQQQQQSQSRQNRRNQQQLNQLEMKMKQSKYETKRLASNQEQNQQQQENLQALSRLRDLARRQQDINERLKELQNALQAAETEEEKEDVRRRLKRLMEEQARLMEQMDELDQRMQRPENQQRMAESRMDLQRSRQNAQRTAEAMEQGEVSRALASGTRTQKQLEDLKEDFRKKGASKFAEDMREMRDVARALADKQKDLTERLAGKSDEPKKQRKSLVDDNKEAETSEELKQQGKQLKELMQHAEQVTRQSEFAEPLLHKHLYDAVRNQVQREGKSVTQTRDELIRKRVLTSSIVQMLRDATETGETKSLDIASELSRIGFNEPAETISKSNQDNFEELERRISRAAESVLGDEAEALRQARREINDLTRQLAEEVLRANPNRFLTNQLAQANVGASGQQMQQNQPGNRPGQDQAQQGRTGERQGQQGRQANRDGQQQGQQGQQGNRDGRQQGQQRQQGNRDGQQQGQQGQQANRGRQQQGQQGQQGNRDGQQQGQGQGEQRQMANNQQNQPGQQNQRGQQGRDGRQANRNTNSRGGRTGGSYGGWEGILPEGIIAERDGHNQGPITGEDYANWADRMRNVEEMVNTSELRNEITKVRERVRSMRVDFKRHSKEPQWDMVQTQVMTPLVEIRDRISEELARRGSREAMVRIDRDPVPTRFADVVRKYYESLGSDR